MKSIIQISVFCILTGLTACKKDPLPVLPDGNDPVYTVRGLLNGDSLNYRVGVDNVTIHYGLSEMNGVPSYFGKLNAPADEFELTIELIRPENTYNENGFRPIESKSYNFLVHDDGCITLKFGSAYGQYNHVLIKDSNNDYVVMDQIEFDEFGVHELFVKFTDISTSTQIFHVPIKYGFEETAPGPGFQSYGSGDTVFIYPFNSELSHRWIIDGQFAGDDIYYSSYMADGIHSVEHICVDEWGNEKSYRTLIRFKNGEYYWQMTYNYCDGPAIAQSYDKVRITVVNNGQTFRSDLSDDNLAQSLSISDIQYFINSSNQHTWALYNFNCSKVELLNDNQTESLSLQGLTGTFKIGLK